MLDSNKKETNGLLAFITACEKKRQIAWLGREQISWLSSVQISWLDREQIFWLRPEQISWLSPEQISWLSPVQISWLSPEQISWLSPVQISWFEKIFEKSLLKRKEKKMGRYVMNINNRELLPEDWRNFEIVDCILFTSKKGNETFKIIASDCQTYQQLEIYAVATKGERWFLLSILKACRIPSSNDQYTWEEKDVIGRRFAGKVKNVKEKYITQYGEEEEKTKSKIVEVRAIDAPEETVEEILPF